MAIDEAIFRGAQCAPVAPTLRFYGWLKPSISIGYFQSKASEIDAVACRREGIDIVCRPTGGKAVYHDDDFTYAVIAGDHEPLFPSDIMGTHRIISECLVMALGRLGIEAELAGSRTDDHAERLKSSCFSIPSSGEILVGGRKICGSAQVRSRGVFLQHGSLLVTFDAIKTYEVMLPHMEPKEDHIKRLRDSVTSLSEYLAFDPGEMHLKISSVLAGAFASRFNVPLKEGKLTSEEEHTKTQLLRTKYQQLPGSREKNM